MFDEREERVRALLPLVRAIARRIKRLVPTVDVEDLIGDGCVGLIRAVDSFDPQRGTYLEHYASRLVSGAILNGIRRMDPVPERARRKVREGECYRYELACERGRVPSDRDVERGRPGFLRAGTIAHRIVPLSLDAPLPERERIAHDHSNDPAVLVVERAANRELHRAIVALPTRQRDIVLNHYYACRSLREIGQAMAITPQRASQLHKTAIARLRKEWHAAPG